MQKRGKIPPSIEGQVLLANRHACCICQKAFIQIHHIDENPNNNNPSNLAVLCMDHHNLASMKGGMTRKLKPAEIIKYKEEWENKCEVDILALTRDRLNFYATAYKNPPRIREMFIKLSNQRRKKAIDVLVNQIVEEEPNKIADQGFKWQAVPREHGYTTRCLKSILNGELWPSWLPRVKGHPLDPDYPTDLSSPNGMGAFHIFDLYCQLIVRVISISNGCLPLENVRHLETPSLIDSFSGNLVTFRQRAYGTYIMPSWNCERQTVGRVRFRSQLNKIIYREEMSIKNMYVFSDTAVEYLRREKVCGIGMLGGVTQGVGSRAKEVRMQITPLLIGVGGYQGPNPEGWWHFR